MQVKSFPVVLTGGNVSKPLQRGPQVHFGAFDFGFDSLEEVQRRQKLPGMPIPMEFDVTLASAESPTYAIHRQRQRDWAVKEAQAQELLEAFRSLRLIFRLPIPAVRGFVTAANNAIRYPEQTFARRRMEKLTELTFIRPHSLLAQRNNVRKAFECFDEALELAPLNSQTYELLGKLALDTMQQPEIYHRKLIEKDGTSLDRILEEACQRAIKLYKLPPEVQGLAANIVEAPGSDPERSAFMTLSRYYALKGDSDKAAAYQKRFESVSP